MLAAENYEPIAGVANGWRNKADAGDLIFGRPGQSLEELVAELNADLAGAED